MSSVTYYEYTRLSDSIERTVTRNALSCGEPVSIVAGIKSVFSAIKRGLVSFADFCADVSTVMAEARTRGMYYGGTRW
jgi:hypothetical protein